MSLVTTFRVGNLTCHALEGGVQRLDGGAMFGVVPKELWNRRIEADGRNRIPLALRCLLIEHPDGPVLVDTGIGNKESEKFCDLYGIDNEGVHGPTRLDDALNEVGLTARDVRWVVNTHLHFDHAGGNTVVPPGGGPDDEPCVAFPEATYVVQEGDLAFGLRTNERTAGSYFPKNFAPVTHADRWKLVSGDAEILPGVRAILTPGHVPHHQSILIEDGGEKACFLADLVPTTAHLSLPWIMGYDLEPLVTLESKRRLLTQAEEESWLLVFEHDPEHALGRVVRKGKSVGFQALAG
ncbi:MAG: MBL fold metallo-hydrolase [Gemmatimonadetes bacterium]|nr:MBL fold metallo-hydrolase [Gemmatimonadota bacterium]